MIHNVIVVATQTFMMLVSGGVASNVLHLRQSVTRYKVIEWKVVEPDDERPVYGPVCPGPLIHRWTLTLEDGASINSGCYECDFKIELHDVFFETHGRLAFRHEHLDEPCPNAIRFLPCDCNYWYEFIQE